MTAGCQRPFSTLLTGKKASRSVYDISLRPHSIGTVLTMILVPVLYSTIFKLKPAAKAEA